MKKEKKTHGVQLLLRMVVKDSDGKVLSDTGQKPSKSFVIQFLEFIHILFTGPAGTVDATMTNGAEGEYYNSVTDNSQQFRVDAAANTASYGIVVGTGDTAETNTDFRLASKIAEGAGVGQLTHGSVVIGITTVVGVNVDLELSRAFTNNTVAAITVEEAGIYGVQRAVRFFCYIRDVLVSSINIPAGCSLSVYYTFRTTV